MTDSEVTLDQKTVEVLASMLDPDNGAVRYYIFTSRANRDAVWSELRNRGVRPSVISRTSIRNQNLDPRYTVEGMHLEDKGLMNDYRHFWPVLYRLEVRAGTDEW